MVDDLPQNIRLLEAVLSSRDYTVFAAMSGAEALELIARVHPDLVMLDIIMPVMDGYEVCRKIRDDPATQTLPVVMVTSSDEAEKLKALEAGADDFIPRPFNQAELLARVKSLVRVKRFQDIVIAQAAELAEWNRTLETRVTEQVAELERLARLRRFFSPQLADLIVSSGDEAVLKSHRREIAVLFVDLRGFTSFAETAEPEEVMAVLREFHEVAGALVRRYEATVGFFAGDGLMLYFNDPVACPDPAGRAVRMAVELRTEMGVVINSWARRGYALDFGVGVAYGYSTLGEIGFEGRSDYGVIGSVVNLASRLCDQADGGEILISQRAQAAVDGEIDTERAPDLTLKGFARPQAAHRVVSRAVRDAAP